MDFEVQGIGKNHFTPPQKKRPQQVKKPNNEGYEQFKKSQTQIKDSLEKSLLEQEKQAAKIDPERYIRDIMNMTSMFNKRLKYSINRDLNQVVVQVIDKETDKVIKEIPPEDLLKLHARIKEAIGLLIDEEI